MYPPKPKQRLSSPAGPARGKAAIRNRLRPFARDEDGALIIFGLAMFTLIAAIAGLSLDLMRYEAERERLQSTLDRAVLAAASLTQSLDPKTVVLDYFAKAGMSDYITPDDILVVEGVNFRKVMAAAKVRVPLHFGSFEVFSGAGNPDNALVAQANSTAQESIGNVEISMVLDVSGSMNWYNRLTNLKSAAKDFLDTVYDAAEPYSVSTSIIPYATQVNAGETLLSYWNRNNPHPFSYCVNFTSADFNSAALPVTQTLEQTADFDPWTNENGSFDLGETIPYPVCPSDADKDGDTDREIMAWSSSKSALKAYIDNLSATGNTSTDVGTKWGAALLDPAARSILTGMIGSGDVVDEFSGRPFDYEKGDSMKILVVMTDGAHTSQYYMDDYKSGNSFVWRYVENGVKYYSIWYDGTGSTPITSPSGNYTYCDGPYWSNGSCGDWDYGSNPDFWFVAYSDDGYSNTYQWQSTPYGGSNAQRMTWDEVWNEIPPEYFSDEVLYEMGSLYSSERNAYEYAMDYVGSSTKNARFDAICNAAKGSNNDRIIIFTIGLEVSSTNAARLEACASAPSYYYDVDNLDINFAFQSIAAQINQLRLTQ